MAGEERLTPHQSEDSSPTTQTLRMKEERETVEENYAARNLGQLNCIGPALKTRQLSTIKYWVSKIVLQ